MENSSRSSGLQSLNEWDWLKVLEWKNGELRRQGRQEIPRVHANELNNFQGEYSVAGIQHSRLQFFYRARRLKDCREEVNCTRLIRGLIVALLFQQAF